MAGSQDAWRISGEDRSKHDAQFFQLKPVNGFVTGTQARDFFMQSGLPTAVLGQIWTLADMNGDGKMDKKEFSIAMHLIKKKLQGYELPKVLPVSLKADPTPVISSFAQPGMGGSMSQPMGMGYPMGGMPASMGGMGMPVASMMQPQASLGTATMTTGSLNMGPRMANGAAGNVHPPGSMGTMPLTGGAPMPVAPGSSAPLSGGSMWAMPHNSKLKHTQTFNVNDRQKRGYLLGVEARAILMQSGLPQEILAQIWTLSDIDRDGKLTCDEFCIAMHLSELARMGHALPPTLPPELIPTKGRSGSVTSPPPVAAVPQKKDAFGDLLTSAGMPAPMPVVPAAPQPAEELAIDEQVTFEDKRKENFDKGQAELERRRALLREQQQKEERERLEKERQEQEKREKQRIEAENRRQAELQRQLERQREKEREIEEQRRKMIEQREAARRELERQRQMEWEKQRKEQLMAEKQREYEQLSIMKSQMANLKNELETLDAKKAELALKITQVKKGVTDFTSSIDAMRVSRDRTLADIDVFERQSTELNKKLGSLGGEKDMLNVQVQTAQATPLSDTHRTVTNSVEAKRTSIQKLKKEVEQLESDTEARLGEIDCSNAELTNLKEQIAKLERDLPMLQKQQEERAAQQKKMSQELQQKQKTEKERQSKLKQEIAQAQKKAPPALPSKPASDAQPSWFDFNSSDAITSSSAAAASAVSWDTAFSGTSTSSTYGNVPAWGGTTATKKGSKDKIRYRALYDFAATRDDELSLTIGQEIMVLANYSPVPGMEDWYKGEYNGHVGWFPRAYVEQVDEPSTDLFGSAFEPVVKSSSAQKTETVQQDLFSTQFSQPSAISNPPATNSADVVPGSSIPPEGLLAKATYPWKARQESDLTFDKDDVILVRQQEEMKWFGELNGKSGWFPKAYVKLIGVAPKSGLPADTTSQVKAPSSLSTSPAPPDTQGEYYVALYTYTSDEPSDLIFNEGDIIYVTATTGDWWSGTIAEQGKSGIFPANYVKKLEIQPETTKSGDTTGSSTFDSMLGDFASNLAPARAPSSSYADNNLFGSSVEGQNTSTPTAPPSSAAEDFDLMGMTFGGGPTSSADVGGIDLMEMTFGGAPQSSMSDAKSGLDMMDFAFDAAPVSSSSDVHGDFDLMGITFGGAQASSSAGAQGSLDLTGMISGHEPVTASVTDSTIGASLSTETKPTQAVSRAISFDGFGSSTTDSISGAQPAPSSTTKWGQDDMFGDLSAFSWGNDMATSSSSTTETSVMQGVKDKDMSDNLSGDGNPQGSSEEGKTKTDQGGLGNDLMGSIGTDAFGDEDPFADEFGMSNAGIGNTGQPASGSQQFDSLDWGFGDTPGTTAASASGLGASLMDAFGGMDDSTGTQKSSTGFAAFDSLSGGTFSLDLTANVSKNTATPGSSLPDILALENDAIQNNALDAKTPTSLLGDISVPVSASQVTSDVQVDLDMTRPRSASKPAPPPPAAAAPKSEPEQKSVKKPEIAKVIAPYVATGTGQLSLEIGNLINVRQKSPRGWWEGELQVRGQKKKIGWFPANYVKLLGGSSARSTPEPTAGATLSIGAQGSRSATPQSIASQDGVASMNQAETVVSLYAYTAQNDDELTFQKDAVITVLSRDNPDWWSGQLDGQTGVFPSNYVTPNPQSHSWMNDTQGALSKAERKRQQAIQELINTEESYNTDMLTALEVFKKPLMNSNTIPKEQVNQIFVNWEELIVCNKKLLQALRVRKKMCGKNGVIVSIGDILCESLPHMNPYMRFCSCQLSAAATLQRVSESSSAFQEFHRQCMQNPKVKGVHMSGFLLKPMQRITRYPLLIEKILENTPTDHPDRGNLEEALTQAQELCTQANQCVKEKQNSDSLEWIQAHVHCDGLAENIVFNSLTNCMGPRRLLFHGILCKVKSNKELVGFLFNDFFLLAQTSRPLGSNFSTVHLFGTNTQFKMYRTPIFLNEVTVKKSPDEAEPSHFSVTSDRILNLKAISAVERDTWVREIEAASRQYKDKAKRKLERAHSVLRAKPVGRVLVVVEEGVGLRPALDAVKRPNVGRILVVIQEACHLKASDASGKSDPYCEVSMGSQEHRTKVIPGTLNPRWNTSMQFSIRDVDRDTLCFTVYDRDLYSPNDFLGRTEVRIKDVLDENGERRGPITKRLILHEVETGEVVVKLDLQLYES